MIKKNVCVIGNFNGDLESYDGQTIKTKNIYVELEKIYGSSNIDKVDTYYIRKKPISFFINFIIKEKNASNIIILPAHNSIKVLLPILVVLKKKFQKIHYILIGGWLPTYLDEHKYLIKYVKKVDYIYPETIRVKNLLMEKNINNTYILKNFKNLIKSKSKTKKERKKFRFCIFSRIEKQKGIIDAIQVVNRINKNYNNICSLDIYGKVDESFYKEFEYIVNDSPNIKYCGVKKSNESVTTISKYDALLFPTKYFTEGIPGTIIDSFFAGVPSISSKWESFSDILSDGENCIGYDFNDINDFYSKVEKIIKNPGVLVELSNNCLLEADKYLPKESLKSLINNIEE